MTTSLSTLRWSAIAFLSSITAASGCAADDSSKTDDEEDTPSTGAGGSTMEGGDGDTVSPGSGGVLGDGDGDDGMDPMLGGAGGVAGGTGGAAQEEEPASICPQGPFGAPFEGNQTAQLLDLEFKLEGESISLQLEGPVWSAEEGLLFFSDKNPKWHDGPDTWQDPASASIWKLAPGGQPEVHVLESGSNGLALDEHGNLLAATHSNRNLTVYDIKTPNTVLGTLLDEGENNNEGVYNSPNDVAVSSNGIVYFTDPTWQNSSDNKPAAAAYFIDEEGQVEAFDTFSQPNGVSLSPDEKTLYVGNNSSKVRKYSIDDDGRPVRDPEDGFLTESLSGKWSDGFAIDCAGNVYVTVQVEDEVGVGGVDVLSPEGTHLGTIDVGGTATNAAFGGTDRKTLYITRNSGIYAIDLNVPGFPY